LWGRAWVKHQVGLGCRQGGHRQEAQVRRVRKQAAFDHPKKTEDHGNGGKKMGIKSKGKTT